MLFERSGRNLLPTRAARELLRRSSAILETAGQTDPGPDEGGLLPRVAAPPAFAQGFVSAGLIELSRRRPQCRMRLEVRSTPMIIDMLADGLTDIGRRDGQVRHPGLRSIPF